MAFTLISAPDSVPTSTADWAKINNVLLTIGMALLSPARISGGKVIRGSVVHFAGAWYVTDSDTAISGTASNYVKLTNTAGTVTASYSASLTGVSWNKTWNGYYNASGEYFIFDTMKARGAGLISDVYGLALWQPQDAGMAKFLSSALTSSSLSVPITNGAGSGVKFKRTGPAGSTTKLGSHTNTVVISFSLSSLNGVIAPLGGFYIPLSWSVNTFQTLTVKVLEGSTELYSATHEASGSDFSSGSSVEFITPGGNVSGVARNFSVVFSASGGNGPGIRQSSLTASSYLFLQPPNPPSIIDTYAERIIGGIFDGKSVITEGFS